VTFDRASVLQGFRDGLPIAIAAIPFGLIIGLSGVQAGLTALQSSAMPYVVYAGAAQLAWLERLGGGAPRGVKWGTAAHKKVRVQI
jgi:predicted branched-subunit amino acid permease